jgi:predicted NBD/HSP70 family sugar kinase
LAEKLGGPESAQVDAVFRRAAAGEASALAAVSRAGHALGVALAGAVNLIDVGQVVLGGDFAILEPMLRSALLAELGRRAPAWGWSPFDQEVRAAAGPRMPALNGAALAAIDPVAADPEPHLP